MDHVGRSKSFLTRNTITIFQIIHNNFNVVILFRTILGKVECCKKVRFQIRICGPMRAYALSNYSSDQFYRNTKAWDCRDFKNLFA